MLGCGGAVLARELLLQGDRPAQLAALRDNLHRHGLRVRLAPAGGVTAANAVAYARAGADFLVTSLPEDRPDPRAIVKLTRV